MRAAGPHAGWGLWVRGLASVARFMLQAAGCATGGSMLACLRQALSRPNTGVARRRTSVNMLVHVCVCSRALTPTGSWPGSTVAAEATGPGPRCTTQPQSVSPNRLARPPAQLGSDALLCRAEDVASNPLLLACANTVAGEQESDAGCGCQASPRNITTADSSRSIDALSSRHESRYSASLRRRLTSLRSATTARRAASSAMHLFLACTAMSAVPSWVRTVSLGVYTAEAEVAADLALRCGAAMRSTTAALRTATLKDGEDGGIDPVTQTDVDNEALVQSGLLARFPHHAVIGEESAAAAGSIPAVDPSTPTWVVDPIDGTQNFVHGLPLSCVSIGLCIGGRPTLGVVYDPYRDELFIGVAEQTPSGTEATAGPAAGLRAAYLNGERIHADKTVKSLEKAIVGTDAGYERTPQGIVRIAAAQSGLLLRNVFAVRILGSSVLSVAYVACGRANAFYSGLAKRDCPKPWDWCAAAAIGEASGVVFRRFDSASGFHFEAPTGLCCAGSEELADELEETLREATGGKPMG